MADVKFKQKCFWAVHPDPVERLIIPPEKLRPENLWKMMKSLDKIKNMEKWREHQSLKLRWLCVVGGFFVLF